MFHRSKLFIVLSVILLSACDGSVRREGPPAPAWLQVVRADTERNRLWVLEPEALSLHDNISGRRCGASR